MTARHVIQKFRWFWSLKKFNLDGRKSPKFLDDVADRYWPTHVKSITTAIGDPESLGSIHLFDLFVKCSTYPLFELGIGSQNCWSFTKIRPNATTL